MQATLAIARLTFKAALRFRLVAVMGVLLLGVVLVLPRVIMHDGTARGLAQIVLTYNLGLITAVLGLCTMWLACGTLARDIEGCQLQVVSVKPLSRAQIWLGKWLGVMALNVALLGVTSAIVYVQLRWQARGLSAAEQTILEHEVFVARSSAREPAPDLEPEVEQLVAERRKNPAVAAMPLKDVQRLVREQVKQQYQLVPPGYMRTWRIPMRGAREKVREQVLFLRVKFFAAEKTANGTYAGIWEAGPEESPNRWRDIKSQAAETFHEFPIPPGLLDAEGLLRVSFLNQNETAILFPIEEGMEVLYREGGFGLNYLRGLGIVLCWLALLAAIGLAAASFLSFPVAAFFALGVLLLAFSTGTMKQVIDQGTIRDVNPDTGQVAEPNLFDAATVGFFRGLLAAVELVRDFSPIDSLSSGRSVTWWTLGRAAGQIVVVVGGLFALIGVSAFNRRELAAVEGQT